MSKLTDHELSWAKERFHNYGTSSIPSAVSNCLFLSPGAKQLYSNLCQHAYGEKKAVFLHNRY
ncbi:hypothetical protein BC351_33110 [Paenibacillus ferrarius]|uniref:Uncharacterized protein n=1 Tax=Paenibacillus ferrarius TaxID=1469647 RepID=A0A1V4HE90_9BACL|nr:hypothetical protein [Paenibacillus ferrarius]OPH52174.1 hypothetical protein BC351_33110 [Paenibacillus ferrarius]